MRHHHLGAYLQRARARGGVFLFFRGGGGAALCRELARRVRLAGRAVGWGGEAGETNAHHERTRIAMIRVVCA